jgi:hypothetical protein
MKAMHKNFERNERICEQRKLEKTYKSIGLEFGLLGTQIKQICIEHERLKWRIEQGGVFLLSTRAQCVIKNHSYDDDLDWSFESLIKIPNCGPKTTKEILEYIEGLEEANESAN